jgi:hypothetical protein
MSLVSRTIFVFVASLLLLSLLLVSRDVVDAIAFDLPAKKYRCFTEEVTSNTWMTVSYKAASGYAQVLDVKITDPKGNVLHDEAATTRGSFETYSGTGGDYAVCFYSRMSSGVRAAEGMKRTILLEWRGASGGQDEVDYAALASREHMKPMELHLRMMLDTVRGLHSQYEFFKFREAQMRDTNEYLNARVMWFTVMIVAVLAGFAFFQVSHLKRYFKKKKLID